MGTQPDLSNLWLLSEVCSGVEKSFLVAHKLSILYEEPVLVCFENTGQFINFKLKGVLRLSDPSLRSQRMQWGPGKWWALLTGE